MDMPVCYISCVWYVHIPVNIYNIYANIHLHILLFLFLSICTENHNFKPVTPIPVQHHWQFILVFSLSTFVTLPPDRNMIPIILSVFTYLINFPIYNQCPMATDASSPTCLLLNMHHLHHWHCIPICPCNIFCFRIYTYWKIILT